MKVLLLSLLLFRVNCWAGFDNQVGKSKISRMKPYFRKTKTMQCWPQDLQFVVYMPLTLA